MSISPLGMLGSVLNFGYRLMRVLELLLFGILAPDTFESL